MCECINWIIVTVFLFQLVTATVGVVCTVAKTWWHKLAFFFSGGLKCLQICFHRVLALPCSASCRLSIRPPVSSCFVRVVCRFVPPLLWNWFSDYRCATSLKLGLGLSLVSNGFARALVDLWISASLFINEAREGSSSFRQRSWDVGWDVRFESRWWLLTFSSWNVSSGMFQFRIL